jgi:hypothetical protein
MTEIGEGPAIYEIQSTGKLSGSISTAGVGLVRYQPGEPEKE